MPADTDSLLRLDGRVALVTGASYGLGVLFAEVLAQAGADVAVMARSKDKLDDTRAIVEAHGRRCAVVEGDVTSFGYAQLPQPWDEWNGDAGVPIGPVTVP